mmetsp:Transcript_21650/g.86045  ORF Transcript_21650/g.86045 Transcript_21650/m.86045 type:complete len:275 (+) Transcript_21650:626-1450(+)
MGPNSFVSTSPTSGNVSSSAQLTMRFPAASGLLMARTWVSDTSRTSTNPSPMSGNIGSSRVMIRLTISNDAPGLGDTDGPNTPAGLTTVRLNAGDSRLTKSQAAFSAMVFDLLYACSRPMFSTWLHVVSSYLREGVLSVWPNAMAAHDDVMTTRFTLGEHAHASRMVVVPRTAGPTSSSSVFGGSNGNGDAVCRTYVHSAVAALNSSTELFMRSNATNSRRSAPSRSSKNFVFFASDGSRTVPRTRSVASLSRSRTIIEAMYPFAPVTRTRSIV